MPTVDKNDNIFDRIRIHRLAGTANRQFGGDHAGKVETSAMMELHPSLVDMSRHSKEHWYAESALDATREFGCAYLDAIVEQLDELLFNKEE